MAKIWANSGDSHLLEPEDIWYQVLPKKLADKTPRTVTEGNEQITYIGDQVMTRTIPSPRRQKWNELFRPPGALRTDTRLQDLDDQGIYGEICFPSAGFFTSNVNDVELAREMSMGWNEWAKSEVMEASGRRLYPTAIVSVYDTDDAVSELQRAAEMGFKLIYMPTTPPPNRQYNADVWDPFWAAADEAGMVPAFHIGTGLEPVQFRGAGGAVINYVETALPGIRTLTMLVASGALDRHPDLKVLVAEGGGSWIPAMADRMTEAYRQHSLFVRPTLSKLPKEIVYRQVYTSFQHDESAIPTVMHLGYENMLWGSDYPHVEGTFPETQKVLHELFDDVPDAVRRLITIDAFNRLVGADFQPPSGD
jgi:predicted TIM-barrel fold metal-dependent hydrolase